MVPLPELQLQRVVLGLGFVGEQPDGVAGRERVGLEEVDRLRARRVVAERAARRQAVADEPAEIDVRARQRIRQRAGLSLLELRDERAAREAAAAGERRLRAARPERGLEDRQRHLSRQSVVGEPGAAVRHVDRQVPLRVPELRRRKPFSKMFTSLKS